MVYKLTRKNVLEAMNKGKRLDLRGLLDRRPVEVRFGVSKNAEGSVIVKCGKTEVACGIKMNVSTPYTDHEGEGTMMTAMELLPLASPNFEYGQPSIESVEIARVVDRGIRESGFIDFEKLCIKEGEKVWSIYIDMATINDDGNLIDVGALAAILALMTARFPEYDEKTEKVKFGEFTDKPLPLNEDKLPLTVTFFKMGDNLFIDPTREEEDSSEARLTMEISRSDVKSEMINAMQKGGEAPFSVEEVEKIVDEATKVFKNLKSFVDKELEVVKKADKKDKKSKKD